MNLIENYKNQIQQIAERSDISIDPKNTLLLIVDIMNDGNSDEGFFKKVLQFDISMFQNIEDNLVQLMSSCKKALIPVVCVSSIYNSEYIPPAMRKRFEAMGMLGGLDPKGSWGSRIIAKLLKLNPDLILIKSHYSVFSKLYSFAYKPNTNQELENYLMLPAQNDAKITSQGGKTMQNYFQEADKAEIKNIDTHLDNGGIVTLEIFLKMKAINTLIITGGSTHVCEDAAVAAASERGYHIIEPIDAVASEDFDKHFVYVHNHGLFKTQLTTTEKILEALKRIKNM